jgi:hypothetical protein
MTLPATEPRGRAAAISGAVAVVLLVAGLRATSPVSADTSPIVISPQRGQVLPAKSLVVRVRASDRKGALKASLNGEPIESYFAAARRGVRSVRVSASHGLRHGRNVLRVTVRARGRARSSTVRFRLRRDRPLAAAGIDREVSAGATMSLSALRSRGTGRGAGGGGLRFRWSVVKAPAGSDLVGDQQGRATSAAAGGIAGRSSATPAVTVDAPGTYVMSLRATASDGTSGIDTVTLKVDPPPLVPIDTMVRQNGVPGIQVGGMFYPASATKWIQIVVLDRTTLRMVDKSVYAPGGNTEYDCPAADTEPYANAGSFVVGCTNALRADLQKLNSNYLVIASSQRPPTAGGPDPNSDAWKARPPVGVDAALTSLIGTPLVRLQNLATRYLRGRFSGLGVPGGEANSGFIHMPDDLANYRDDGELKGYLVVDNNNDYSYASAEHLPFDTQAPDSNDGQAVVEIAGKRFASAVPAGSRGGFQVVVVDRLGLDGQSRYFDTTTPSDPTGVFQQMRDVVTAADGGNNLVVISSRGDPTIRAGAGAITDERELNNALMKLVDATEDLGGSRLRMFTMLDPRLYNGNSYTLVGSSQSRGSTGAESLGTGSSGNHALNKAPLVGLLTRSSNDYGFRVEDDTTERVLTGPGLKVVQTAYQPTTPWPDEGNAARQAAIKFISNFHTVNLGDDPRAQYYTQSWDQIFWQGKRDAIDAINPSDYSGDKQAFLWAQKELHDEITWLNETHSYLHTLTMPFTKGSATAWAKLINISADVKNKVNVTDDNKADGIAFAVLDGARDLAESLPEPAGLAVHAVNSIYNSVMEIAKIADGELAKEAFSVRVGDFASKLADRLQAAQDMIEIRLANVLVADYGKLRTMGLCTQLTSDCPGGPDAWQIDTNSQATAVNVMKSSIEASIYAGLLPIKYDAYQLPFDRFRQANDRFQGYDLAGFYCPFQQEPGNAQIARPINLDIPLYRNIRGDRGVQEGERWEVRALGYIDGGGTVIPHSPYVMHTPAASVVDRLFKGPSDGGLGVYPEKFFVNNFPRATIDHYPLADSDVDWDDNTKCDHGPTTPNPYAVRFTAKRATVAANGTVGLPFRFTAETSGSIALRATARSASAKTRKITIGRASFRATAAGRSTIRLRLTARGRALVARARGRWLRVEAVVGFRQGARNFKGTTPLTLSMRR